MITIVVRELFQQMTILSSSLLKYTNSQQVFQWLNLSFWLTICLRMIC